MLDFYFISDEKPVRTRGLLYAGSIEYEEFTKAQDAKLIENHLDYYGKFRWSSQQGWQKRRMLTPVVEAIIPGLAFILKRVVASECGLVSIGD